MHADTIAEDVLMPLSQAAKWAGKSPRTLKRWVDRGIIDGKRKGKYKTAPILVSKLKLRSYLATLDRPSLSHVEAPADDIAEVRADRADPMREFVEELKDDKARLLSQVSLLQTELADVRQQLTDCQQARSAVERELINATQDRAEFRQAIADLRRQVEQGHRERSDLERQMRGGVRGLLRGAVQRFRR